MASLKIGLRIMRRAVFVGLVASGLLLLVPVWGPGQSIGGLTRSVNSTTVDTETWMAADRHKLAERTGKLRRGWSLLLCP